MATCPLTTTDLQEPFSLLLKANKVEDAGPVRSCTPESSWIRDVLKHGQVLKC